MNNQKLICCPSCGAKIQAHEEICPYCSAVNAYASETKYQRDMEGLARKINRSPKEDRRALILHETRHQLILIMGTICVFLAVLGILYLIISRMDAQNLENLRSLVSHGL